jgi:hypothetical protein
MKKEKKEKLKGIQDNSVPTSDMTLTQRSHKATRR